MSRRAVLMEALAATPRDLERTLRRVDDARAAEPAGQDGRSIRDVVAHLVMLEAGNLRRWRAVIAARRGEPPDVESTGSEGEPVTLADLVVQFVGQRKATLAFLQGLEQREWGTIIDAGPPQIRLRDDVQGLVTHDNEHLARLLDLRTETASK